MEKIKVKCEKCDKDFWTNYSPEMSCCFCNGPVMEYMISQEDYRWKEQLEKQYYEATA